MFLQDNYIQAMDLYLVLPPFMFQVTPLTLPPRANTLQEPTVQLLCVI